MEQNSDVFWARVDVQGPDECWLWSGSQDYGGYGTVRWGSKMQKTHRVAYRLLVGEIPRGMFLLHQCDVRSCCNPAHMKLGTHAENMAEMAARGRWKAVGDSHRRTLSDERKAELKDAWFTALFWAKVDRRGSDECWLWTAGVNDKGYGTFGFQGRVRGAHRVAFILANGPIIDSEMCVCHACDTPRCCNPSHLWLGTRADNNADKQRKGRCSRLGGARGEKHGHAKLSDAQVAEIRRRYVPGTVRLKDLAVEYGISLSHTCAIVNQKARI